VPASTLLDKPLSTLPFVIDARTPIFISCATYDDDDDATFFKPTFFCAYYDNESSSSFSSCSFNPPISTLWILLRRIGLILAAGTWGAVNEFFFGKFPPKWGNDEALAP